LKTLDTGPITNHVNIIHNANGTFAYVTVGGLNEIKVYRTSNFAQVATIRVGALPHGIWPSGDGKRVYVGLEIADRRPELAETPDKRSLLARTDHATYCPYKGDASYYSIAAGGNRGVNAVWTYEAPHESVAAIKDHLAFYPDRVESIELT
jgi:hypothetical protein